MRRARPAVWLMTPVAKTFARQSGGAAVRSLPQPPLPGFIRPAGGTATPPPPPPPPPAVAKAVPTTASSVAPPLPNKGRGLPAEASAAVSQQQQHQQQQRRAVVSLSSIAPPLPSVAALAQNAKKKDEVPPPPGVRSVVQPAAAWVSPPLPNARSAGGGAPAAPIAGAPLPNGISAFAAAAIAQKNADRQAMRQQHQHQQQLHLHQLGSAPPVRNIPAPGPPLPAGVPNRQPPPPTAASTIAPPLPRSVAAKAAMGGGLAAVMAQGLHANRIITRVEPPLRSVGGSAGAVRPMLPGAVTAKSVLPPSAVRTAAGVALGGAARGVATGIRPFVVGPPMGAAAAGFGATMMSSLSRQTVLPPTAKPAGNINTNGNNNNTAAASSSNAINTMNANNANGLNRNRERAAILAEQVNLQSRSVPSGFMIVMDTCAALDLSVESILRLANKNTVILPYTMLSEIEKHIGSRDKKEFRRQASLAVRDMLLAQHDKFVLQSRQDVDHDYQGRFQSDMSPDDRILGCAVFFRKCQPPAGSRDAPKRFVLLTNDKLLMVKAKFEGIDTITVADLQRG